MRVDQIRAVFFMDERVVRLQRRFRVQHRRERVRFDTDAHGSPNCLVARFRNHQRHDIAGIADLVVRKDAEVLDDLTVPVHAGHIGCRQHADNAGSSLRVAV